MSDFHILEQVPKKDGAACAFHYATPAGNNVAGMAYSAALIEYLDSQYVKNYGTDARPISVVPDLENDDPTEYAALEAGTIAEYTTTVRYDANSNNAAKQAAVVARYDAVESKVLDEITERLRFWSGAGDAP